MRCQVTCEWHLTPSQEARISSVVFAGTMVGSYGWGALSDAQGRRRGFAVPAIFTFACGIASALAPNYAVRPAARNAPCWVDGRVLTCSCLSLKTWMG